MKNKLTIVLLLAASLFAAQAQPVVVNTNTSPPTLSGPGMDAIKSLATATNWLAAPFMTYGSETHDVGGGLALVYNITDTVGTMLRVDYYGNKWSMVSANLQLQLPITVASNAQVTTFGYTGISMPVSGSDKGTVQGLFGAGVDLKFPKLSRHWSAAVAAEYWTQERGVQWRFAPFVWKF